MNQVSSSKRTTTDDFYKLPEDFPINDVCDNLIRTLRTLGGFTSNDEWIHWRYEFLRNTLHAFASSESFQKLTPTERADMMECWINLQYVLEVLGDLFTDEVNENCSSICHYLEKKLLPAKSTQQ